MKRDIAWLLEGPAWVRYRVQTELTGSPEAEKNRQELLLSPEVKSLLADLKGWPGKVLTSHKSSDHLLHKLVFAADLGLRASDPGVMDILRRVTAHASPEGLFPVRMNVPVHFGGTGKDCWAWALCDAPSILYSLGTMDFPNRELKPGVDAIRRLATDSGWRCSVSPELGKFRGPGRKDDPCPYANLVSIKALLPSARGKKDPAAAAGAEAILDEWQHRRNRHPYMFFMGSDFCKLKAPLVWYDLLHVLDVLSRLPWLAKDKRLRDMADVLCRKANQDGRFTAESVWLPWKTWEFGQKKKPSRWITAIAYGILDRLHIA
jgi:hypothetical protein